MNTGSRGKHLIVAVAALLSWTASAQQQQPPPARPADAKPPAKRVRVNLAGFELAPPSQTQSSTQLGGGTRTLSGGDPAALAPAIGRSFSATPTFAWRHASQAQKFEFRLLDQGGAVVHRAVVSGRQYVYPQDAWPLQPGATYRWTVQPQTSMMGGASSPATIVRLSQPEIDVVSQLLAHPPAGVDAAEWRAQVFTDQRVWYDAIAAWTALIDRFPNRAEFREKRGQIYDQLPVTQALADDDFAAAERLRAGGR